MIFVAAAAFAYCVIRLSLFCLVSFCFLLFFEKSALCKEVEEQPRNMPIPSCFQADHNNELKQRVCASFQEHNKKIYVCVCVKRIYAFAQIAQPEIPELAAAQPARPAQVLYGASEQEKERERETERQSDRAY